ncbi:MAG: Fmu (Sun) domain-containing protein [Bacteroidota bacterium]
MNRYERYLHLSAELIKSFNGEEPFSNHLKRFFLEHKKLGSRDRKQISTCCYAYFRTGHLLDDLDPKERIPKALFLFPTVSNPVLENLYPDLNSYINLSLEKKCILINIQGDENLIFPWINHLSIGINASLFSLSHLQQPKLFLRIRPGKKDVVENKLKHNSILYDKINEDAIALENGVDISSVLHLDKEVVIQDYSSQRLSFFLLLVPYPNNQNISVWDCCAASGGKSILCKDFFPNCSLTVSDIRASVLRNLSARFHRAGIEFKKILIADLTKKTPSELVENTFDLIIADVPCTGSGTWSRTPEWLQYFKEEDIAEYSLLQQKIISNVIPCLKNGGYFLYSTCSVFSAENEKQVEFMIQHFELELIEMKIISGSECHADTMFGALLKKK